MLKTVFERTLTGIKTRFFYGNELCSGILTSCLENGVFIITSNCYPLHTKFDLLIHSDKKVLKVPVKVFSLFKVNDLYEGMGVELLD